MPNWGAAGSGAASGAAMGSMFGPWGTAIGAGVGGLAGLFKKKPKAGAGSIGPSPELWDRYNKAADTNTADYGRLSGGYDKFAQTGGFSPEDLSAIRSRSMSPMASVYSNANREVDRSRALQGGYSPGFGVLKARMAREQGQGMADASTNTEAAIAQLVQQGKLEGLRGGSSLYGTTPGLTNMFGNQALGYDELGFRKSQGSTGLDRNLSRLGTIFDIAGRVGGGIAAARGGGR
jgi:hypothetical protein